MRRKYAREVTMYYVQNGYAMAGEHDQYRVGSIGRSERLAFC